MKPYKLLTFIFILGLFFSSFSYAEEKEHDYREFIDIVYEWTPYGNMIQVGDVTISDIRSVWLDEGNKDLVEVSKSYIHQGDLVKPLLIKKDANGFWIADEIIVFSGKGLDAVIKNLSFMKKKEFLERKKAD